LAGFPDVVVLLEPEASETCAGRSVLWEVLLRDGNTREATPRNGITKIQIGK
jgi:hypothetical protein